MTDDKQRQDGIFSAPGPGIAIELAKAALRPLFHSPVESKPEPKPELEPESGCSGESSEMPDKPDKSAWVRAASIWTKYGDRFNNGKAFRRFLNSHPEIRHKHNGQRLEVHTGDWLRYLDAEDKGLLEALDVNQAQADAALEILRKKRRQ